MTERLDATLRFHQTALNARAFRQQVIASNIANADTPNYKARDIDFSSALQSALDVNKGGPLKTTAPKHYELPPHGAGTLANGTPLQYRGIVQGAVDGNTVDMDVERNQFADNALRYEAGITMINHQIKGLLAAIQGQ